MAGGPQLPPAPPAQRHRIRSQPESQSINQSINQSGLISPIESPNSTAKLKSGLGSALAPPPAVIAHIQRPRLASHESDDSVEENKVQPINKSINRSPNQPINQSTNSNPSSPLLLPNASPMSFAEKRRIGKEAAAARELYETNHPINQSINQTFSRLKSRLSALNESRGFWLVVYSILLLLTSVGNSIYFKKMINKMENYVYFLNQFTTIIFAPIFFSFVFYQFYFTDDITKEMTQFPKIKFFWMGAFDSVSGVLTLFGAVHTSGSNQALLTNAVIPVTMVMSYVLLHERFRGREYIGSAIIMLGIVVVLLPQMFPDYFGSDQIEEGDAKDLPFFNFLFVLSVIPGALSSIYKEMAFVDADIDANYLQAWVALWQSLFGFLLVPLNTMSFLGPQSVPFDKLWSSFIDGMYCLCGVDTLIPPDCTRHHTSESRLPACDNCDGAWIPIVLYIIFNLLFNVFTVLLIKYGSATLMFIIMTLRMPMVQWAFSLRVFNDPPDIFSWASGAGLGVILIGLICYRWPSREQVDTELPESQPLLYRAKTTGMMRTGDYGDLERSVILPVLGFNQVFAARHFAQRQGLKLARTGSQIRSSFYEKLGVISSPMTTRSPMTTITRSPHMDNQDQSLNLSYYPRASPPTRNSSRALTKYGTMDDSSV